jgi:pimeloyl-ACP methyl ester carboxylesterase
MEPVPFTVAIPDEQLEDMRRRIRTTRWAPDFGNESGRYGIERGWLEELARYWSEDFDWRAQEAAINRFPQFRTEIDGVPIHFVHVRGRGPNPKPLILTHGWPWTFWDWKDVIGPLVDPAAFGGDPATSFDVVVPSLPGYGFSTPLATTGINARSVAGLWVKLMRDVLGYDRFAAGGGDWGAVVTAEIGHGYAEHLTGVWLTLPMLPGVNLRGLSPDDFAPDEQWMVEQIARARPVIQAHRTVHQYEPQTIAYALADSAGATGATTTVIRCRCSTATSSARRRRSTG